MVHICIRDISILIDDRLVWGLFFECPRKFHFISFQIVFDFKTDDPVHHWYERLVQGDEIICILIMILAFRILYRMWLKLWKKSVLAIEATDTMPNIHVVCSLFYFYLHRFVSLLFIVQFNCFKRYKKRIEFNTIRFIKIHYVGSLNSFSFLLILFWFSFRLWEQTHRKEFHCLSFGFSFRFLKRKSITFANVNHHCIMTVCINYINWCFRFVWFVFVAVFFHSPL